MRKIKPIHFSDMSSERSDFRLDSCMGRFIMYYVLYLRLDSCMDRLIVYYVLYLRFDSCMDRLPIICCVASN